MEKTSDYLHNMWLGFDPKSDDLIIQAMEKFHKDKVAELITDLKIKEVAHLTFMRENLLDDTKRDDIKYVSAQKEIVSEIIEKLEKEIEVSSSYIHVRTDEVPKWISELDAYRAKIRESLVNPKSKNDISEIEFCHPLDVHKSK